MRSTLFFALLLLVSTAWANNDVRGHKDPNEIRLVTNGKRTLDVQYQSLLRSQPNWQNFLLDNGTWYVHFNETNGKPHKAFGKPIDVAGTTPIEKAENFIQQHLTGFGIPTDDLELLTVTSNEYAHNVFFGQRHNGMKVLFARLSVKLTLDGKVISFSADVYNHLDVDATVISASDAATAAMQNLHGEVTSVDGNSEVMVLPVPEHVRKRTVFKPVFEVTVNTKDEDGIPGIYLTYVDALDGNILLRKNLVSHSESEPPAASVEVTADVSLTQPYNPTTNSMLPNLEITQGGSTFYTDGSGNATGLGAGNATFKMKGLWSEVFSNSVTPTFTTSLSGSANSIDWGVNANVRESSAYYHVNIIHDYMKTKFPSFTSMDNALQTNIDVSGSCNAFYNGTSINFYQQGAGCNSYATVADVVYHEYGHGINDKYYQSQGGFWLNGAMGEGYADVWALGITQSPVMGLGNSQNDPNNFIRRYDMDRKVYPQDLVGEVHSDGEIIAGAWWDLGQNFGDIQQMMDLYVATYDALITGVDGTEGDVFVDILIEALLVDDAGDNDISNGTPNDLAIINAFDAHGITLLSNATLNHTAIESHDFSDINIDMTVVNDYPWALSDALVSYRLNTSTTWTNLSMTNTSGSNYSGVIPGQPGGTIVAYYVALENLNGTLANVQPIAADLVEPNVPNYILVGYEQNRIEDFDNFQDNDWQEGLSSDNNSTGSWVIDIPNGSFSEDDVMVQTDEDHTPGSNNIACAITGNANSGDGIGENDVDDGHTTLQTPAFDLTAFSNPAISYWRYYTNSPPSGANPGADWWQVLITNNGTDWTYVENSKVSDPSWRRVAVRVTDYVSLTDNVQLRFIASDSLRPGLELDGGSLVEGAMDDLAIWELTDPSGIEESELGDFNIYPNPSNGSIKLSFVLTSNTDVKVDVLNVVGAAVFTHNLGEMSTGKYNQELDLTAISSGVYFLRVQTNSGSTIKRLELIR